MYIFHIHILLCHCVIILLGYLIAETLVFLNCSNILTSDNLAININWDCFRASQHCKSIVGLWVKNFPSGLRASSASGRSSMDDDKAFLDKQTNEIVNAGGRSPRLK